jgi:DNA repair protein RadC
MNTNVYDRDCSSFPEIWEEEEEERPRLFSSPLTLPLEDRPREKLIRYGPESLSDRELLAVFLVSGVQGRNVSILSRDLLERLDREKAIPPVKDLCRLSGMGESKAASVAAMLEFGRRKWAPGRRVRNPSDIFSLISHYADRAQERFLCLSLNGAHEVIAVRVVTIGLVNRTIVHPREVFADPIKDRASAVIVAHNHPSGALQPSGEDTEITLKLKAAADILGIRFLDHLIFSESSWFSYRQNGKIEGESRSDFE